MSPNEQKITSGRRAIASPRSIISTGVTHTGQPGPWISPTGARNATTYYDTEPLRETLLELVDLGRILAST
jgi:hypothetical protein